MQEIAEVAKTSDGSTVSATTLLNRFLFPHETFNKRVDILSGGEKRRLYLLIVLMQNPNLLILDEPTNDLDIVTLNILEEYLKEFSGSLIIVSHDRHFLDKLVDHLFIFCGNGLVKDFVGSYSEYREFIKEYEAEIARFDRQIEALLQSNGSSGDGMLENSSGLICPIQYSGRYISSGYYRNQN